MGMTIEDLKRSLSAVYTEGINELGEKYQAVQILPELKKKYPTQLRPEILSVRIYQTDKLCYLEVTEEILPANEATTFDDPKEDNLMFSDKSYLTERTPYLSAHDSGTAKDLSSIFENAFSFIEEYDDLSKISTTNLFTDEGAEELAHRIETGADLNPPEYENRSGERSYSHDQIMSMEGYDSNSDHDAVDTPLFAWFIEKGFCFFNMYEDHRLFEHDPFADCGKMPDRIVFNEVKDEDYTIHFIKVPVEIIRGVKIISEVDFSEPYKKMGDYNVTIDLVGGGQLKIAAWSVENPPEYWYYNHNVIIKS